LASVLQLTLKILKKSVKRFSFTAVALKAISTTAFFYTFTAIKAVNSHKNLQKSIKRRK
jgi:hypothetical protein